MDLVVHKFMHQNGAEQGAHGCFYLTALAFSINIFFLIRHNLKKEIFRDATLILIFFTSALHHQKNTKKHVKNSKNLIFIRVGLKDIISSYIT